MAGDPSRREKVAASLASLRLRLAPCDGVDDALRAVDLDTVAIVLVPPLRNAEPTAEPVRALRSDPRSGKLPLFVVLPDQTDARSVRRLYAEGATAVIEWPREALLLPRVVLELLAVAPRPRSARPIDRALARAAMARLRLVEGVGADLRVGAFDGVLHLRGSVPSLRLKETLVSFAEHVPGAKGVAARGLEVDGAGSSDRTVARRVRSLLGDIVEGDTLSVSVNDGHVVLMGTVEDRSAFEQVVALLSSVRGVRAITNLTRESPARRRRDHDVARSLQKAVEQAHPGARVRVAVLGDVAVVTGEVDRINTRTAIERRLRCEAEIARVVDKLEVRG
ncbi:MAG: BON domain-containing protein [Myxococcota bacterium]